ncbi:hypothetical protein V8G54_011959 [Vigna mungo]|uniref:Uncharacterized protein n=1 Tax=Vigna mungo TaxID=3915 RepID=A0AAQ3NTU0_VIGMU
MVKNVDGEGVYGCEIDEYGGLREDLGERRQIDDGEGLCGRETKGDGGLIQHMGDTREIDDDDEGVGGSQTHRDGGITQYLGDLSDIKEQVREYEPITFVDKEVIVGGRSTSNDDGNGEVNRMKGLVDINVECEGDCYGNMHVEHVEVEFVSHENERSSWSDMSKLDLDDDDISDSGLLNDE